jgi:hypothetical protein
MGAWIIKGLQIGRLITKAATPALVPNRLADY